MLDRLGDESRRVVARAGEEARQLGHPHIGTEHLLLGLLAEQESNTARALTAAGASLVSAREKVQEALASRTDSGASRRSPRPAADLPFTDRANRALDRAGRLSLRSRRDEVGSEHILISVLDVEGTAGQVLRGLGVNPDSVRRALTSTAGEAPLPDRHFGWQDMFVPPGEDPRSQAPTVGERATLLGYLAGYRQTLELKCAGLDAEAMARRSVPPSDLSLLGLVRHLADVERYWFRQVLGGEDAGHLFRTAADRDAAFRGADPDPELVEQAWRAWRAEVEHAQQFVASADDLEVTGHRASTGEEVSLREVLVHMIEEYARHCGHADLLRERIDGRVGQ